MTYNKERYEQARDIAENTGNDKNTTSERQASFRERRKAGGLVEMRVWIPEASRDDVKAFCAELREEIRELKLL